MVRKNSLQEFTCEICVEPASTNRKFSNRNLCSHQFCLDCVSKYIEVKISEHIAKIECPGLNCEHNLDAVSCKSLISKPLFTKWCDLLCEDSVLGIEKCYCPNRECLEVVLEECGDGYVEESKCPNCKQLFCFQCKNKWHPGFRCRVNEAMNRDPNDTLFETLMEIKKWKRCPACGRCVELRSVNVINLESYYLPSINGVDARHIFAITVDGGARSTGTGHALLMVITSSSSKGKEM
ncbi:E3 ubiquitin-protein ligase RSL1-like [Rutidosis leptorrhynchoides]|uniref:E3 ubiquitin-protein ligase RSL1-like n=1 Tax=Rutidosis leptorrhynchoides TaxID=125765 RepID=UPI003A994541